MSVNIDYIIELLGNEADSLLNFNNPKIKKDSLSLPSPNFIEKVLVDSDRSNNVLKNLSMIYNHGRLSGTGYLSILPVDQGGRSCRQRSKPRRIDQSGRDVGHEPGVVPAFPRCRGGRPDRRRQQLLL